jgi:tetratricopeptide (TPR) repeat protein
VALYALAVLAKSVAVVLPGVLLALIWWKRGVIRQRDGLAVLPFVIAGVPLALVSMWHQRHVVGASGELFQLSPIDRVLLAGRVFWLYLAKDAWPAHLAFIYGRWVIDARDALQWLAPLAAVALGVALWLLRRRIGRGPLAAAAVFIIVLFPALGFFNVYWQIYAFVADHVQYAALLAVAAAVATAVWSMRRMAIPLSAVIVIVLAVLTWNRCGAFHSAEALWLDTITKTPDSRMAYVNYGVCLMDLGRRDEAETQFHRALEFGDSADVRFNLGRIAEWHGDTSAAATDYRQAVKLEPAWAQPHFLLGNLDLSAGRIADAESEFKSAVDIDPANEPAAVALANLLERSGQRDQAIAVLRRTCTAFPNATVARSKLDELLRAN